MGAWAGIAPGGLGARAGAGRSQPRLRPGSWREFLDRHGRLLHPAGPGVATLQRGVRRFVRARLAPVGDPGR